MRIALTFLTSLWLATSCGFSGQATPDGGLGPDGAPGDVVWTKSSQADFKMGTAGNSLLSTRDTLEPRAFLQGFRLNSRDKQAMLDAIDFDAPGFDPSSLIDGNGDEAPIGVTITPTLQIYPESNNDDIPWFRFTTDKYLVWGNGEIFLQAGMSLFTASCDDDCIFQIDTGNGFATAVATNSGERGFAVASSGWYPARLLWYNSSGNQRFDLSWKDPTEASPAAQAGRLRFDVSELDGAYQEGFLNGGGTGDGGNTLDAGLLLNRTFPAPGDTGSSVPEYLAAADDKAWTARWTGQAYFPTRFDQVLTATSTTGGARLAIDGKIVADSLVATATRPAQAQVSLDPGWHDISIWAHAQGPMTATLDPVLSTMTVRPAVSDALRHVRLTLDHNDLDAAANEPKSTAIQVKLPVNARAQMADLYLEIGDVDDSYTFRLIPPGGTAMDVAATPVSNNRYYYGSLPVTALADGTWTLQINNGDDFTDFRKAQVVIYYGLPSLPANDANSTIEPVTNYLSEVRNTSKPMRVSSVTWRTIPATLSPMANVKVFMRGCNDAACVSAAPEIEVINGSPASPVTGQAFQYRIQLTSADGIAVPILDDIQVNLTPL